MFLIDVQYTVPLEQVDAALEDHIAFLRENYEKGNFLVSGRKVPRTGGMILARAMDGDELDAILQTDPFARRQLAQYTVTEFVASMSSPELASLIEG